MKLTTLTVTLLFGFASFACGDKESKSTRTATDDQPQSLSPTAIPESEPGVDSQLVNGGSQKTATNEEEAARYSGITYWACPFLTNNGYYTWGGANGFVDGKTTTAALVGTSGNGTPFSAGILNISAAVGAGDAYNRAVRGRTHYCALIAKWGYTCTDVSLACAAY